MNKTKIQNLLIYLQGILVFQFTPVFTNNVLAEFVNKNKFDEKNVNFDSYKLKPFEKFAKYSHGLNISKSEIIEDLKENGEKLFNLLAFEEKDLNEKDLKEINLVEIDSDIQYREKDIFNAEGNAIIYLSNATLKGDLIKYDLQKKLLTVVGNVVFKKGEQYFEASKLFYDLKKDTGYIENVYGLLDSKTFTKDFKLAINQNDEKVIDQKSKNEVTKPEYINTTTIGLVNSFEDDKLVNITKADLEIPEISRWRYKTDRFTFDSKILKSKKIFFTNDIYNEPQFIFLSKNFSAEILDNKLRLISRGSWIILDNKLKIPIGRRSVFDKDPLTKWGFGADFKDKDGYYLLRGTYPRKIFRDYSIQLQPYFLIQRAIKGHTDSFTAKNSSIFSSKVKNDLDFLDYFALDVNLKGKENNWNVTSKIQLNSLNTKRLDESLRTNLTLTKRIKIDENFGNEISFSEEKSLSNLLGIEENNITISSFNEDLNSTSININSEINEKSFSNYLDIQLYNIFREKVVKDFATEEIYFATGLNVSNKKAWLSNDENSNLSLIYDGGHFKSKSSSASEFKDLFRNAFVAQYNYELPIWKRNSLDKSIDKSYKFSPAVIKQSINWLTGFQTGLFLYSDGSSQSVAKFNTGPVLTLGGFKKNYLDYTKVSTDLNYVFKSGESPFSFDNINKDPRISFNLEQQIYGPLVFSYGTTLNLNDGNYSNINYALDFKRRAYSIGAFYNSSDESLGIRFNIFNFDYSGISKEFKDL